MNETPTFLLSNEAIFLNRPQYYNFMIKWESVKCVKLNSEQ
jgi:hypothetical protein